MKVWLVRDNDPLPSKKYNRRLFRMGLLAEALSKSDHDVTWWCTDFNHFEKQTIEPVDIPEQADIGYEIRAFKGLGYRRNISFERIKHNKQFAADFYSSALCASVKPDLIVTTIPTVEASDKAVAFARQFNIPVIVDLRDMWPDIMVLHFPKMIRSFVRLFLNGKFRLMSKLTQNATGLCSITDPFLQWGLNYAKRKQSHYDAVIPFGYNSQDAVKPLDGDKAFWLEKGLSQDIELITISFVGSLNDNLLPQFIRAFHQAPSHLQLVIAGTGKRADKLHQLAKSNPRIIFSGWIDKGKIAYLLEHSHYGLLPYYGRKDFLASIPNKVSEYLSSGLPIISLLDGCVGHLIREEQLGYVLNELTQNAILKLLKDVSKLSTHTLTTMQHNAKRYFHRHFQLDNVMNQFVTYLESVHKKHSCRTEHNDIINSI